MSTQYQSGYKLRNLRAFLVTVVGDKIAKRMDCEMSNISLNLTPVNMGHGFDLMQQRYTVEFLFDKFPHREYDPAVLFANVGAWLLDNDSERDDLDELGDPEIDIILEDEKNAEVLITIEFEEPVKITELVDGPIYWRGKRWGIAQYDIDIATAFQLTASRSD